MKYWYALIMVIFAAVLISPASAWLSGYTYEKDLTLSTSGWSSSVSNCQVYVHVYRTSGSDSGSTVYVGSGILSNFSDIRFTDTTDTIIPYWIQTTNGTNDATVWVNVPSVSSSTTTPLRLYYQNSGASAGSNATATWSLYDDFTGASLNGSVWSSSGTIVVSGSKAIVGGTSGNNAGQIYPVATYGLGTFMLWNGTTPVGTAGNDAYIEGYSTNVRFAWNNVNSRVNIRGTADYASGASTSAYHTLIIKNMPSTGYWAVDPTTNSYSSLSSSGYTSAYPTISKISDVPSASPYIDWVAIGNTGGTEPSYSWGTQTIGTSAQFTANQTTIAPGAWVQFNDTSSGTPDHWWWDFGDGNTSTTRNATAKYWTAGTYNVTLTAQQSGANSTLTKTGYISVGQPPTTSFTTNKTSGQNPLSIAFTDTSTLSPTFWNWSFGEGGANTTTQNAVHTYTSSGSYQVILTSGNAYGSTSASTTITVQSSNNATGYGQYYASKTTTFHVQSAFGAPVSGATVTMQGVATSTGSWDWLGQLLGLRFNETPVDTYLMTTTTDSNGEAQFMVLPSVRYNVTIYQAGVISKTFTVTPTDDRYVVMLDWSIFGPTGQDVNAVDSFNLTQTIVSSNEVTLRVTGTDTLGHITGGTIVVNQTTNGTATTIYTTAIPVGNFSIDIPITGYAGNSYLVHIAATQSDYGTVYHDFGVTFPKAKVRPLNLDDKSLFMVSMVILFAVGGIFTATTKDKGALITCFAGWILYSLGYLDYMGSNVPIWLTFATVVSIAFILVIGKVKQG